MKKIFLFILFNLFFIKFTFAEIVTLDDGRTVDLKEDGTFNVISGNTDTNNENSIVSLLNLLAIIYIHPQKLLTNKTNWLLKDFRFF